MSSIRDQILSRAATVLAGVSGAQIYRSRETSITRAVSPAITILFGSEQDKRMGAATDAHELRIVVAIFVRGDPWDSLADPVALQAHSLLMADALPGSAGGLAGLGVDLRKVSTETEAEEADRTAGTLVVTYHATYLTSAFDMSRLPAP